MPGSLAQCGQYLHNVHYKLPSLKTTEQKFEQNIMSNYTTNIENYSNHKLFWIDYLNRSKFTCERVVSVERVHINRKYIFLEKEHNTNARNNISIAKVNVNSSNPLKLTNIR